MTYKKKINLPLKKTILPQKKQESIIQQEIVRFLRARKVAFCHIRNEFSPKNITEHFTRYKMGVVAGVPDLCVFLSKGKTIWLEVKTDKGSLSIAQKSFHNKISKLQHRVFVVRNVYDVINVLKNVR